MHPIRSTTRHHSDRAVPCPPARACAAPPPPANFRSRPRRPPCDHLSTAAASRPTRCVASSRSRAIAVVVRTFCRAFVVSPAHLLPSPSLDDRRHHAMRALARARSGAVGDPRLRVVFVRATRAAATAVVLAAGAPVVHRRAPGPIAALRADSPSLASCACSFLSRAFAIVRHSLAGSS
ncbi:hypothetical protein Scep_017495 [Stephania cephalantha]|uniref:Uncharacterized protein n=1 Tax=Stephania cephalantha TaxID=152367 RepID=A0AAP0IRH6_9MAGN